MSTPRACTWPLLILNFALYMVILSLAGWAVNTSLDSTLTGDSQVTYYFIIFAFVAGAVGVGSTFVGFDHVRTWTLESYSNSAAIAAVSLVLTLEALGLASKEINEGLLRDAELRALEIIVIIVSAFQLVYTVVLQWAKVKGEFL